MRLEGAAEMCWDVTCEQRSRRTSVGVRADARKAEEEERRKTGKNVSGWCSSKEVLVNLIGAPVKDFL